MYGRTDVLERVRARLDAVEETTSFSRERLRE
jgi:hypothetical protein